MARLAARAALTLACLVSAGAGRAPPPVAPPPPPLSAMAQLGQGLFFDPSLSRSGLQSCASCHDPDHAFAPANARPVQMGGPDLSRPGIRATPSLGYKIFTPGFSVGPESLLEAETAAPTGPLSGQLSGAAKSAAPNTDLALRGGLAWDGRADTLQIQTLAPLLSPFEMDNPDSAAVIAKLRRAPYAQTLAQLSGQPPDSATRMDGDLLLSEAQFALARFQVEDPRFHAFTSKYDFYLRGQARLSAAEARGLKLFDNPKKGNCAACHLDKPGPDGAPPAFTDYEFEALGLPRNSAIPANADPAFFDLGVCGPLRDDAFSRQGENCGLFKTPTLRNAATRQVFFHNGVYYSLKDAVRFYVLRDTQPQKIYPIGPDGKVDRFNDLPTLYRANIDVVDAPMDRKLGARPALTEREMDDVVAFIGTLTDGYQAALSSKR